MAVCAWEKCGRELPPPPAKRARPRMFCTVACRMGAYRERLYADRKSLDPYARRAER